ncbi:hypothetical protein GGP81_001909 [Salinibacter ruber]|uniref:capsular polysaccharide export protein, LipB/KpsS family n=1 Tax=Salinibacter ruber TaxID=146919 RepID=UPI00216A57E6|nr:hypothetical protein [Salinibacter ruber]MCS3955384.1 hypothetical protein [Salinibacter ruber]
MEPRLADLIKQIEIEKVKRKESRPYLLVDGINNTMYNTLSCIAIAKAAASAQKVNVGYLCINNDESQFSHKLYQKAGLDAFEIGNSNSRKLESLATAIVDRILNGDKLMEKTIGAIQGGDLVYDTILRENNDVYTLSQANYLKKIKEIARAYYISEGVEEILQYRHITGLVISHKVYTKFGIPARMAFKKGLTLISKSKSHLKTIGNASELFTSDYKLSDDEIDNIIETVGRKKLTEYFEDRVRGQTDDEDAQNAYKDKEYCNIRAYVKEKEEAKASVLLAPHVFSDAPHGGGSMCYRDYYQWYNDTISLLDGLSIAVSFVKPHPTASSYNEAGVVEKIAGRYKNVYLISSSMSTRSVLQQVDVVVTVRGTIGLESIVYDCGVITCGDSVYEDLNPVVKATSKDDYISALKSVDEMKSLNSRRSKTKAMALLYYKFKSYNFESPYIGRELDIGLSPSDRLRSSCEQLQDYRRATKQGGYAGSRYYRALLDFFQTYNKKSLSILDLQHETTF